MKKILIIILAATLLPACGLKNSMTSSATGNANSGATGPAPSAAAKPVVGDSVVAKSGNWYAEGKVQSINGQKANIVWTRKDREASDIDLANVYVIPKADAPPAVKVDDFVVAKTSTYSENSDWDHMQVTGVTKDVITVKERGTGTYNLSPDKVIALSPTDAADIKSEFAQYDKQTAFDKKAQVGRPVAPDGYKPKVGETVVAASSQNIWYIGPVKSITADKAVIVWDTKQNSTFETTLDRIVPNPTAATSAGAMPAVNDYVLIKNTSCPTCAMIYSQVTAVNGTNIEAIDRYDAKYTVRPGEFLLLK